MSKQIKRKLDKDADISETIFNVLKILSISGLIFSSFWFYFSVYKPTEKKFIKNSRYAYSIIQDELREFYKENGKIYDDIDETTDQFCEVLKRKYSRKNGSCKISQIVGQKENIRLKNKIYIYGFEKKPIKYDGTLIKDILIDVDGEKGKNTIGIDRVPVRIYSSGRMGGMLSPVNCNVEDSKRFELDYSSMCEAGVDINFMNTNLPFKYDILQIGGKNGKTRYLGKNLPFLRADCTAFGGELIGAIDFCEQKGFHWMTACYYDYFCSIKFVDKK